MSSDDTYVSPFAPASLPDLPAIRGARLAACEAGIRYQGRKDLMLALFDAGTTVAGVLTQSKTAAAPILWCRDCLPAGRGRALVVNSGNANAFTGQRGLEAVRTTAEQAARAASCAPEEVFISSTGVIGEALDASAFTHLLSGLADDADSNGWEDAARAIMTTDTFPKLATRRVSIAGVEVTLNGIAKGSGMIAPDMATMLSYIVTDAPIGAVALQAFVASGAATTFNCITVDGDTSTSDTVLAFATGAAAADGVPLIDDPADPRLGAFRDALHDLMRELAHLIVKDGEGLTKFVTIAISGAEDHRAARRIGLSIANSPLVKTAIAGEDPNWGRIVMAIGKAGEAADRDRVSISFGDFHVAREGVCVPDYHEPDVAAYMKNAEITISVDVGVGNGQATVWTCDLTHDYISINADYRS